MKIGYHVSIVLIAAAFASLACGCSNPFEEIKDFVDSDTPSASKTGKLTISNQTNYDLDFVRWVNAEGKEYYFEPDEVFDTALNKTVGGMRAGSSATMQVASGEGPLYFFFAAGGAERRTVELVRVKAGSSAIFVLTNVTPVDQRYVLSYVGVDRYSAWMRRKQP